VLRRWVKKLRDQSIRMHRVMVYQLCQCVEFTFGCDVHLRTKGSSTCEIWGSHFGEYIIIYDKNLYFFIILFIYCFFTIYSRYLKGVISKRDGCEYLKKVPSIDGSLELIWWDPLATFCWVFLFQVDWTGLLLVVVSCSPIFVILRICSYDFCYIWYA
jgi:hypothetical protein